MSADSGNKPTPDTVRSWCEAAAKGDIESLERLLGSHHGRLSAYTIRKIGPDWRGKLEPEDVLQEAFLKIFRDIGSFEYEHEDSFYRWAVRIVDHSFIDAVRALRRKKRDAAREVKPLPRNLSRHESFLAAYLKDSLTASQIARRHDAVGALMSCIAKLPEHYQQVVRRCLIAQEPMADVAAEMDRTEDALRRMAGRAVEKLQECMRDASSYFTSRD